MARTYTDMLNNALEYQRRFNQAHIVALANPGNRAAEREEQRAQLMQIQEELRKAREARAAREAEESAAADAEGE